MVVRVHLDRKDTWPEELAGFVKRALDRIRPHDLDSNEACELRQLDVSDRIEDDFAQTCGHIKVACYHATRLLEHEIENIRAQGLLVLDDDLRRRKLQLAIDQHPDLLTPSDAELILSTGPHSYQRGAVRDGSVCFVTPRVAVKERGLGYLYGQWGGEAIAMTSAAASEVVLRRLDERAVAAIVEFDLALGAFASYRSPWFIPVGTRLGLQRPWGEARTYASVPSEDVKRIWTSRDPDWPDVEEWGRDSSR